MVWEALLGVIVGAVAGLGTSTYLENRRHRRESYARIRGNTRVLGQLYFSKLEARIDFEINYAIWKVRGQPIPSVPYTEAQGARGREDELLKDISLITSQLIADLALAASATSPQTEAHRKVQKALAALEVGVLSISINTGDADERELRAKQLSARQSIEKRIDEHFAEPLADAFYALSSESSMDL